MSDPSLSFALCASEALPAAFASSHTRVRLVFRLAFAFTATPRGCKRARDSRVAVLRESTRLASRSAELA